MLTLGITIIKPSMEVHQIIPFVDLRDGNKRAGCMRYQWIGELEQTVEVRSHKSEVAVSVACEIQYCLVRSNIRVRWSLKNPGNRRFIHAPSRGKGVERVAFDHVYWGPRISRAGRLLP